MTTSREQIGEQLTRLKLRGIEAVLNEELDRAEREAAAPQEVLTRLLAAEDAYRREKSLAYRVTQARLPWPWTLQSFPFDRQPDLNRAQLRALAGLEFVRRHENILLIGPPGTGKSGIAIGLLREACLNGYAGRFYNAQTLIDELYASLADRSTTKLIAQMARYRPLLIDELGYLTLKPEQSNAFFRLMDQRYGRASTIITTNLDPAEWYGLFHNKPLVDAMLDRLQHHCIIIRIQGASLRAPAPVAPSAAPASPAPPATKRRARP